MQRKGNKQHYKNGLPAARFNHKPRRFVTEPNNRRGQCDEHDENDTIMHEQTKATKKINSNACEKATTRCDRTTHDAVNVLGHLLASFLCVEKLFEFFSILNPNKKVKVKREAALLFSRTKESTAVSEDALFVCAFLVQVPQPIKSLDHEKL